jgi:hypothetical protein
LPLLIVSLALSANAEPADWLAPDALVLNPPTASIQKWLARMSGSIKYAFMFLAPILCRLVAIVRARERFEPISLSEK